MSPIKPEFCGKCRREIGVSEQACVFNGEIVCAKCDKALRDSLTYKSAPGAQDKVRLLRPSVSLDTYLRDSIARKKSGYIHRPNTIERSSSGHFGRSSSLRKQRQWSKKKKAKLIALVGIIAIIFGIWYIHTVSTQKDTIKKSRERITIVEQSIEKGHLQTANSLLIQLEIDLRGLDRFYTPPSVERHRQEIANQQRNLEERFKNRMVAVHEVLNSVTNFLKSGNFDDAQKYIRKALSLSENDYTLLSIARYIDRLKAQDFKGADDTISGLTRNLPEELTVTQIAGALSELVQSERKANRESQAKISSIVKSSVDLSISRESDQFKPELKGRAMVWDFTKEEIDQAYELLPDDLRASSRDGIVTMFCILKRENIEVGRYSISNQPAYREKMTIGVVYWPEKTSPGTATVWGGHPPSSRPVRYSPEYGSSVKIKEWIEGLPRK